MSAPGVGLAANPYAAEPWCRAIDAAAEGAIDAPSEGAIDAPAEPFMLQQSC